MKEKVLEALEQVIDDIRSYQDEDLLAKGIIDSFDIVNIVVELEDAFEIEIDAEYVVPENFKTIEAITALVEKIQKA